MGEEAHLLLADRSCLQHQDVQLEEKARKSVQMCEDAHVAELLRRGGRAGLQQGTWQGENQSLGPLVAWQLTALHNVHGWWNGEAGGVAKHKGRWRWLYLRHYSCLEKCPGEECLRLVTYKIWSWVFSRFTGCPWKWGGGIDFEWKTGFQPSKLVSKRIFYFLLKIQDPFVGFLKEKHEWSANKPPVVASFSVSVHSDWDTSVITGVSLHQKCGAEVRSCPVLCGRDGSKLVPFHGLPAGMGKDLTLLFSTGQILTSPVFPGKSSCLVFEAIVLEVKFWALKTFSV